MATKSAPKTSGEKADPAADPAKRPAAVELREVPVGQLQANPRNVRRALHIDEPFQASIAANGVRQPLHVTQSGETLTVVAGHRRLAAAISAGRATVPCLVTSASERKEWEDFTEQYTENHHRRDLTVQEEADALFSAYEAGATQKALQKVTGCKRDTVKAALAAGKLGETTREATAGSGYAFTLDQLATLAEFEDDPDDVERLTRAAGFGRWDYTVEAIRLNRAERAEHTRLRADLVTAGHAVTEHLPQSARPLADLEHDGVPLDEESHATCDGRGAYAAPYDLTRFIHYCDDWERCGHTLRSNSTSPDGTAPASDADGSGSAAPSRTDAPPRKLVIEGNKAWKAAASARKIFLVALIARKTPPPQVARFVTEAIMTMPNALTCWLTRAPSMPLMAELLGQGDKALEHGAPELRNKTTDKRLPLLQLAAIATAYEHSTAGAPDSNYVWRTEQIGYADRRADARTWLRFLIELGYTPSPIEQAVLDDAAYTGDPAPTGTPLVEILAKETADHEARPHHPADSGRTDTSSGDDGAVDDTVPGPDDDAQPDPDDADALGVAAA